MKGIERKTRVAARRRLSRSVRTHIRRQKARIRHAVADTGEREKAVAELVARFRP